MKQFTDKEELLALFVELTNNNREYVLAVTRALTFAQGNQKEPPQNPNSEQRTA